MNFVYDDGGRSKYFRGSCNDCVVRAIAIAEEMDYKQVYDMVNKKLKQNGYQLVRTGGTPRRITRQIMKELGYEWKPIMGIGKGCTMHLNKDELPKDKGTILVQVSKHLVCFKNGMIHDTYDCSKNGTRCVYGYYFKL